MSLHSDLTELGFQAVEIKDIGKDHGFVHYERLSEGYKLYIIHHGTGEIVFNYYKDDEARKLGFRIQYMDDEFLVIEYLKHFIKEYTTSNDA